MPKRVIDEGALENLLSIAQRAQETLDASFGAIEAYIGVDFETLGIEPQHVYDCSADYIIGILDGMGKKRKKK